jgi:hypothetical protein
MAHDGGFEKIGEGNPAAHIPWVKGCDPVAL